MPEGFFTTHTLEGRVRRGAPESAELATKRLALANDGQERAIAWIGLYR
jgi:hypothetical protein